MGNFYTNVTLVGPDDRAVADFLRLQEWRAFVAPIVNGRTVVYDALADQQDTERLGRVARELSDRFGCPALAALNHDDDLLWLELYVRGLRTSAVDPTRGERTGLAALGTALGRPWAVVALPVLLAVPVVFELTRHRWLADLLGLPRWSVGLGYEYLERGESVAGGPERSEFISAG